MMTTDLSVFAVKVLPKIKNPMMTKGTLMAKFIAPIGNPVTKLISVATPLTPPGAT